MKKAIIQVPSMQSEHCQLRVREAVKNINRTHSVEVKPGLVEVDFQNQTQIKEVETVIEELGYTVISMHVEDDKTYAFKTNINCSGCVAKVTPLLEGASGISHWEVDTNSKDKTLTVLSEGATPEEIISRVEKAGFKIEHLKN